jgi:hypothetical protein
MLGARGQDFASIGQQDIDGVAIHMLIHQVLHTAGQHADPAARFVGAFHRTDQIIGKFRLHAGCQRFEFAQITRQQPGEAQAAFREGLLLARDLGAVLTIHWCLVGWGAWATAQQAPAQAPIFCRTTRSGRA